MWSNVTVTPSASLSANQQQPWLVIGSGVGRAMQAGRHRTPGPRHRNPPQGSHAERKRIGVVDGGVVEVEAAVANEFGKAVVVRAAVLLQQAGSDGRRIDQPEGVVVVQPLAAAAPIGAEPRIDFQRRPVGGRSLLFVTWREIAVNKDTY